MHNLTAFIVDGPCQPLSGPNNFDAPFLPCTALVAATCHGLHVLSRKFLQHVAGYKIESW